ncbi:MAG: CHAT domain-containing protein, partial [Planctomycetaceae bacterium]|nr:CHAT domain-containing protein [Planctomycetaceae bacterium]
MSDVQQRPVLLFAFAAEDATIQVEEEARAVEGALASVSGDEGLCKVVVPPFLKVEDVLDLFQRNRNTVAVFHYAGHANGAELLMRTAHGAGAGAAGLATSVRSQAGMKLVFLNGCSTEAQVEQWMAAGVPCVIATTRAIHGEVAKNFAARFYQGLATGASIQTAYDEAVGEADASLKGPSRLLTPVDEAPISQRAADRWPWFIRYAAGAEDVADWNLADAAGDPLAFLPLGKNYRLPEAPYPGLRRFTARDAAVFFGRGRDIRKLYERVTSASAAPIILLHGQAGVGKSSILEAGLAPRLQESYGSGESRNQAWDVETVRIDPQKPLLDSLRNLFRTDSGEVELARCWREREQKSGRPLLVVLDQVEEVFTHTAAAQLQEDWNALVAELEQLFSNQESSPRGKLMLSFRTEWFSRVNQQLSGLWKSEVFIQSLDAVGIVEAIEGPTRRRELQDQYHLGIEAGLAERIAGDLMEDGQSAVAPTLQILLKKLWEEASRLSRHPKLTEELYRSHRATLGEFVRAQFEKIATHSHLSEAAQAAVKAGLLADFLECHVTD